MTYYFAAMMKTGGQGESVTCEVSLYNLSGCIGNSSTPVQVQWLNVQWGPELTTSMTTDMDVVAALISCSVNATGIANAGGEIDSVYLGHVDQRF